ncbi:mechanosensitive ion channel domain-containing protein [Rubripirellula reticaptiva]|uniref:Mechanosensitive channel MscK n=1 Tax=Rubripirellula reticaptiva TaxID=2528013 RepID=A0A5C6EW14_9BACT|nr:mechanosensitive ion channel domain-containing protein [Rubripirellula reticaptiva]TWU51866.1 Mechanosensitive channel MscK precursor [Rubripirellula reticaptiva]
MAHRSICPFANFPHHARSLTASTTAIWLAFLAVMGAQVGFAQNIIYHQPITSSYPVSSFPTNSYPTNSYPTNSYPTTVYPSSSYPVSSYPTTSYPTTSYPTNSYPSSQPVVVHSSTTTSVPVRALPANATTHTQPRQSESISDSSTTLLATPSGSITRLASTRSDSQRSRFTDRRSDDGYREPFPTPIERMLPFGLTMIQSARKSADQFRQIARTASPVAADVAERNAELADQWVELAETHDRLTDRLNVAATKLDETTRDFTDVAAKLDHYGLTPTVGLLLRHKKEQLDAWQVQDSQTLFAGEELKRARTEQLELDLIRHDGTDVVAQASAILTAGGMNPKSDQNASVVSQVQDLLRQRAQWLKSLRSGYHDYQQKLGELDATTTASTQLTRDYRRLIDRQITWIRSDDPLGFSDVGKIPSGLGAVLDSRRSHDFGQAIQRKWRATPVSGIGLVASVVLLCLFRWRVRSWLIKIGSGNRMKESTADARKAAASILTTLTAILIPAIFYAIGRWLGNGVVSESTLHASSGFYAASLVSLFVEVPRQLLRNFGYLDRHINVELPGRSRAMTYLTLIGAGLVLAAYVVTLIGVIDHGMWRDSTARFGFIAAMMLVTWTAHLALRPTGGFLEPMIAKFGGSVIHRVRFVVYLVGVGFPLAMIGLSGLGYGFTASELIQRAIWMLAGLAIAATLWGAVKILSAGAWQKLTGTTPPPRKYDEYGILEPETSVGDAGVLGEHFLELKHHLAFLFQFALVVATIGCIGWIWVDVFPNAHLGNPVVWIADGEPITAMNLVMAFGTLFVAFQLAKLLPALFDALVLQRVSFDEGMEHFSLVLGRCLLFGVGCFMACSLIGVRWQAIQWLAVGLTIGLGFGLQDMVRNLFGGLIVLFEKPARLGDLVTVGKVTGRIAAQKLRTTVVTDNDGREVIIPNKSFVSEDVINWMGAGRLRAIPFEVAVTRDQRPADLCRMLYELVIDQPDVLLSPAPQATLVCVGKRSQRIEVRAWIEEGQDASRFRDSLLRTATSFLSEKRWLAADQPEQPAMQSTIDRDFGSTSRGRKRSA